MSNFVKILPLIKIFSAPHLEQLPGAGKSRAGRLKDVPRRPILCPLKGKFNEALSDRSMAMERYPSGANFKDDA